MDERQGTFETGEPSYQQRQQQAGQQPLQGQQPTQGQQLQPQQPQQGQAQQPPMQPQQAPMGQQPPSQPPQQPVAQSPPPVQPPQQAQPGVGQQPPAQAQQAQVPSQQQQVQQPGLGQQPAAKQGYSQQQQVPQRGAPATQQAARQPLRPDTVTDILQTDVVTADPETSLSAVVEQMERNDVGSVVIVDDGKPVGILTDRKVALALSEFADLSGQQAGELLGGEIVVGEEDTSLFEAIDHLNEHNIRRLPIVDESGALIGIVTLDDILVALARQFTDATAIIESQLSRG